MTLRGIAATGSSGRSRANRLKLAALVACLLLFVFAGKLYAGSSWRGGFRGQGGSLASGRRDSDAASGSNTKTRDKTNDKSYVLVIDCGSSGTRMNAFEFDVVAATTGGMPREAGPRVAVPTWIPSAAAPEEYAPPGTLAALRAQEADWGGCARRRRTSLWALGGRRWTRCRGCRSRHPWGSRRSPRR